MQASVRMRACAHEETPTPAIPLEKRTHLDIDRRILLCLDLVILLRWIHVSHPRSCISSLALDVNRALDRRRNRKSQRVDGVDEQRRKKNVKEGCRRNVRHSSWLPNQLRTPSSVLLSCTMTEFVSERIRDDLNSFATAVWGNAQAVLKRDHTIGVEYIDLTRHVDAFKFFLGSAVRDHVKILVRDEYRAALHALETNDTYCNGACVTGQPGIGTSYNLNLVRLIHASREDAVPRLCTGHTSRAATHGCMAAPDWQPVLCGVQRYSNVPLF